jgi:hypothetical protein
MRMPQINKIRAKKRDIMTNTNEIQMTMRENFENLYLNKLEYLEEMRFLDVFDLP